MYYQENYKETIDEFEVIDTISNTSTSETKLVVDELGNQYAAKIIKTENLSPEYLEQMNEMARKEVEILRNINHPNIVNIYRYNDVGKYISIDGKHSTVIYLLMENCSNGTLFKYLETSGGFNERCSRYLFRQMLEAVDVLHRNGFCHRNIKPEKFLIDDNYNIKLTDFQYSTYLQGDGAGFLYIPVGTEQYKAPEILAGKPYRGDQVDIFSLGVVLFSLRSQNLPFGRADLMDNWYNYLINNNLYYWEKQDYYKGGGFFSVDFQQLVNGMLSYFPDKRITMPYIYNSPWLQGVFSDYDEIYRVFKERRYYLDKKLY